MPKFRVCNSQTGYPMDEEPFEEESLEKAQALVLEGEGIKVEEVEDAKV